MSELLIILDLDETLIFAVNDELSRKASFPAGPYHVYKRPGVDEFLDYVLATFKVAVWTSASEGYAKIITENLFPHPNDLEFVWSSEKCTIRYDFETHQNYVIKNLKKVFKKGYDKKKVLMVDDTAKKIEKQYGNHLHVSSYTGNINDNELYLLKKYLDTLRAESSVRNIEKRGWKNRVP